MVWRSVRYWPWVKPKVARSVGRHVEADDHRLGGVGLDAAHRQGVEERAHRGLKCSKGSRQLRQRYSALQAVEPKADSRSVCRLSQRGQAMAGLRTPADQADRHAGAGIHRAGRRDAVVAQLAAAVVADPVGGPGRRALQRHRHRAQAGGGDGIDHALADDLGGRAAGIGGRQHHLQHRHRRRAHHARCPGHAGSAPAPRGRARWTARPRRAGCGVGRFHRGGIGHHTPPG